MLALEHWRNRELSPSSDLLRQIITGSDFFDRGVFSSQCGQLAFIRTGIQDAALPHAYRFRLPICFAKAAG